MRRGVKGVRGREGEGGRRRMWKNMKGRGRWRKQGRKGGKRAGMGEEWEREQGWGESGRESRDGRRVGERAGMGGEWEREQGWGESGRESRDGGRVGERAGMGGEWGREQGWGESGRESRDGGRVGGKERGEKEKRGRSVCASASVCMHVGGCGVGLICYECI